MSTPDEHAMTRAGQSIEADAFAAGRHFVPADASDADQATALEDQTIADADQTIADADQTASDADQTASDGDQAAVGGRSAGVRP